jgi:hypothetical protein
LRASNDVDLYKDGDDSRFLGGEQNRKLSSNSRNLSAFPKRRANVETLNAVAQLIVALGVIVSLFIWQLRFAKAPLDARGGG